MPELTGRTTRPLEVHWYRPTMLGLSLVLLTLAVAVAQVRLATAQAEGVVGVDYAAFVTFGHRLTETGSPFAPYQLVGPYVRTGQADPAYLYPPPFALLTVPLGLLPAFLWWAVPLGILGWCVASWRPAPWAWPILGAILVWPATSATVIVGGSTMWVAALVAAGLRWGWPAALVALKPSFLPLAFVGAHRRSWRLVAGGLAVVSLAMLPLWFEYLTAMRNAQDVSLAYSLGDLPLALVGVVAWVSRRSPASTREP